MQQTYETIHIPVRFSARQTLDCGQCFLWEEQPDGSFLGTVNGIPARVWDENGALCITSAPGSADTLWRNYFDCALDYDAIRAAFAVDAFSQNAADFGAGIRILNQPPWEALCAFLVSQCNHIPRIRSILQRLCARFGEEIAFDGKILHTFPSPETIAACQPEELDFLRAGYRAPYLLAAAQEVVSGTLDFDALRLLPTEEARSEIMRLRGVGRKVADCFLLFGLHKLDAFPVDTWMKKAAVFYDGDFARFQESPYAGVFQQYIFYYAREHRIGK